MAEIRRVDVQTKIALVLISVIVPTFLLVAIIQYQVTRPILEAEMRQIGISTCKAIATKVVAQKWLTRPSEWPRIEAEVQEQLYLQPSVARLEVYYRENANAPIKLVASNVEQDEGAPVNESALVEQVASDFREDRDDGMSYWDVRVPIRLVESGPRAQGKLVGMVVASISTKTVHRLLETFWRVTATATLASVVILILALNYFLRKTVANERKLRDTEDQNLQLSRRLHETQRQLMNVEKLAVMGQLTANFAHEIGTPLNAIGGHLQLLTEEMRSESGAKSGSERIEIISGELGRIEAIVKGFLQTTAKPFSQRQLTDINRLVDRTLEVVGPRLAGLELDVQRNFDRKLGPLRLVPLDIEQILLNLLNNSLDSLQSKARRSHRHRLKLRVGTEMVRDDSGEWALLSVYDSGVGIKRDDLKNVMKAFFTTKRPGEGTGLGLTICQQIASKYGGVLQVDAKDGAWAKVTLRIPYGASA